MNRHRVHSALYMFAAMMFAMSGCEVDSFFDLSKTGRFEHMPTTIPILERIDVIEREEDPWARATEVTREDLIPSDLTYRLAPGDIITVEILELIAQGQVTTSSRRIDAGGYFRLPVLGDLRAAGLTAQEFQDEIVRLLERDVMRNPVVNVVVEDGAAFRYTLYGAVAGTAVYALRRPDFRLLDALAVAGGVPLTTRKIYLIRQIPLTQEVVPVFDRRDEEDVQGVPSVDIEKLIEQLQENRDNSISPALLRQEGEPLIDIDELEPIRVPKQPAAEIGEVTIQPPLLPTEPAKGDLYIYVEERGEWVRVPSDVPAVPAEVAVAAAQEKLIVERVIEIPYNKLKQGDSSYNIVIRPNDLIYVQEPVVGVVYIDGEIARPGVYTLPANSRVTLSRLVAAAGGPGALAVPERVDLTRIVGEGREATLRLNLAAIRQKTEPDLYLKPDDHIIIGTSWIATPLAVLRSGLRITYGFGFLLDRNFGNDVFGPPPASRFQF